MQTSRVRAIRHAHRETARPELWERRLQRFPEPLRHRVRAVANEHPRLRDLAFSFPALLFALAAPRTGMNTASAIDAAIVGARLRTVAALVDIPMWLRLLPPEAFASPIPALPNGDLFGRQIANHLPRARAAMPGWLRAVGLAFEWADEAQAIWVAREVARNARPLNRIRRQRGLRRYFVDPDYRLRRVCLWAWYSTRVHDPALIPAERWDPTVQFMAAEAAALRWLETIELRMALEHGPIDDMWLQPARVDGFEFVPLRTPEDIAAEASAMQNCLRSYGYSIANNEARLWSVRCAGERAATLEIGIGHTGPLPSVIQLVMAQNKPAPREMWIAARRWLNAHDLNALPVVATSHQYAPAGAAWRTQWRPYWLAKRRIPSWLPMAPPNNAPWNI